jgi:hypothetical protein
MLPNSLDVHVVHGRLHDKQQGNVLTAFNNPKKTPPLIPPQFGEGALCS